MPLAEFLASRPRVSLGTLPTPLDHCPRLTEAVSGSKGPQIYIKRDDLTGFALGGNKVRMLEFLLGQALAEGADCLMTGADVQSNQCRAVAAAAARLGLDCYLAVRRGPKPELQGNYLLQHLFGAEVRMVDVPDPSTSSGEALLAVQRVLDGWETELRAAGRKPYRITGQYIELALKAMVGYMTGGLELAEQFRELPAQPSSIVICAGSGTTQAGFVTALKALGLPQRVIGISILRPAEEIKERIVSLSRMAAEAYGLPCRLEPEEVEVVDGYIGPGYGLSSQEGVEAISLVARTEGILLDPVYTGKTAAGLFDLIRKGTFPADQPVVLVHTGGTPGVFAYNEEIAEGIGVREAAPAGAA
ncbi:MAG TPA: D-cysteine desulfhydrase family protein [Chloroflexota bacterium]|nr:D-cysteine desulfhydrase family protein [Chloroflexota bacterium]